MEKFKASFEPPIPQEQLAERPRVFTPKSFPAVIRFARRFNHLLITMPPKESSADYGEHEETTKTLALQEIENVQSLAELHALVEERTAAAIRRELGEVLRGAETTKGSHPQKGSKSLFKGEDLKLLLGAAADKQFDKIDEKRTGLITTALGMALIGERARTVNMRRALDALPEHALKRLGMNARQREVIGLLFAATEKVSAEYLRLEPYTRIKEPIASRPADALRERRFIAEQFAEIREVIVRFRKDDGTPVFGSDLRDSAFLDYLDSLKESYRAFEADTAAPNPLRAQIKSTQEAQQAFLALHTKFPDFPLIVFPAFSHYGADDAVAGTRRNWQRFGFDPEIRIYWQSKEQCEQQARYHEFRDRFAERIEELYPACVDLAPVRQYRVLIGELLTASGINIRETATSQEEENIVLMTESQPDAAAREAERLFEEYLPRAEDRVIVQSPAFRGLASKRMALHEFGHGIYPERSAAADALGGYDDQLAELKSDLAMWVTAGRVLRSDAERDFGEHSLRALQLSMIADAVRVFREESGTDSAYGLAAQHVLERLAQESVLMKQGGKLIIDTSKLDQDLGPTFEAPLAEIFELYGRAARGNDADLGAARTAAKRITETKPKDILKEICRSR